jgi:hypothetical protein
MQCSLCSSANQAVYTAEINIHFHGLENIDRPGVLIFPKVWVCLDCGSSRFTTPNTELSQLAQCELTPRASTRVGSVGDVVVRRRITFSA